MNTMGSDYPLFFHQIRQKYISHNKRYMSHSFIHPVVPFNDIPSGLMNGQILHALRTGEKFLETGAKPIVDMLKHFGHSSHASAYEKVWHFVQSIADVPNKVLALEQEQGNHLHDSHVSFWLDCFTWWFAHKTHHAATQVHHAAPAVPTPAPVAAPSVPAPAVAPAAERVAQQ
jgi:hypothetical protein